MQSLRTKNRKIRKINLTDMIHKKKKIIIGAGVGLGLLAAYFLMASGNNIAIHPSSRSLIMAHINVWKREKKAKRGHPLPASFHGFVSWGLSHPTHARYRYLIDLGQGNEDVNALAELVLEQAIALGLIDESGILYA